MSEESGLRVCGTLWSRKRREVPLPCASRPSPRGNAGFTFIEIMVRGRQFLRSLRLCRPSHHGTNR